MKYAIVGKGFIYERHRQAIEATGGTIIATCDINPATGPDYFDWVQMFSSSAFREVDTVVILTPNYLHQVIARVALLLGKKVLCEKPLSISCIHGIEDAYTVLQLRNHPKIKGIKAKRVTVEAKMFRDDTYWKSWKGSDDLSGGVLFNLGVHYIDLLVYLLGSPVNVQQCFIVNKRTKAIGTVLFENGLGDFLIEIVDSREKQGRRIFVDGIQIGLSDKDNLSYEDLHKSVYEDFIAGRGVTGRDAEKTLMLIHDLEKHANGLK